MVIASASSASAQVIIYDAPVVAVAPAYYPPTVAIRGRTAAYYAPAYPVAAPVAVRTTSYYSSVSSMPMGTMSYAQPVVAYYPPVAAPVVAARPSYVIGRGVVGQTKVYIPGQPIRNSVRFVTP